jgi:hypothetical protein
LSFALTLSFSLCLVLLHAEMCFAASVTVVGVECGRRAVGADCGGSCGCGSCRGGVFHLSKGYWDSGGWVGGGVVGGGFTSSRCWLW